MLEWNELVKKIKSGKNIESATNIESFAEP
jgi:hypothetical protein